MKGCVAKVISNAEGSGIEIVHVKQGLFQLVARIKGLLFVCSATRKCKGKKADLSNHPYGP